MTERGTGAELPQEQLDNYEKRNRRNIEAAALSNGLDADTYITYIYGIGLEDFLDSYVEESAKQGLAVQALANAENLGVGDEELDSMLEEAAASSGASVEDLLGETTREDYREYYTMTNVIEYLMNNVKVNE